MLLSLEDHMLIDLFAQIQVGEEHTIQKTVSESDVYLYAGIVGDFHPNHVNAIYAAKNLGSRVVHGALLPGFVSRCTVELIGSRLDPPGYAAQTFSIKCVAPVFIGDTICVKVTISNIDQKSRKIFLSADITSQDGRLCAIGETNIKVFKQRSG